LFSHCLGAGNVAGLAAFVSTTQQNYQDVAAAGKIDPVTWAMIDPQFAKAFTDRLNIAKESDLDAGNTLLDPFGSYTIPERCQPVGEFFRLADFDHVNFNTQSASACQL
jgi:hypothetical protein